MMAFMAPRDFKCLLCDQTFTQMSGDLMIPGIDVCGDCLEAAWALEDEALQAYVVEHLRGRGKSVMGIGEGEVLETAVIQHIQKLKQLNE